MIGESRERKVLIWREEKIFFSSRKSLEKEQPKENAQEFCVEMGYASTQDRGGEKKGELQRLPSNSLDPAQSKARNGRQRHSQQSVNKRDLRDGRLGRRFFKDDGGRKNRWEMMPERIQEPGKNNPFKPKRDLGQKALRGGKLRR